jgi:hypothetical protein
LFLWYGGEQYRYQGCQQPGTMRAKRRRIHVGKVAEWNKKRSSAKADDLLKCIAEVSSRGSG